MTPMQPTNPHHSHGGALHTTGLSILALATGQPAWQYAGAAGQAGAGAEKAGRRAGLQGGTARLQV
jgi:hypothetical protein